MIGLPNGLKADESEPVRRAFASDSDTATGRVPRAVLQLNRFEDIQKIVAWANKTGTPLVPVSSTGKHRRGDTVPQVDGSVIVDLSGLNRLVHADTRDKIAIIEAGVDFGTVDGLLKPFGMRAFRPLMPRAGKSVIASYLDREPIINADVHWDPADPFGGTAIVAGNGEMTLNGSAALEGSLTEQIDRGHRHMVTFGPGNVDLTRVVQGSQGTLGIMGWAAIYCERLPQAEDSLLISASTPGPVLAAMREAVHRRICTTAFVVDKVHLALLLGLDMQDAGVLPNWTFFATHAGYMHAPEQKIAWQRADLEELAKRHGTTASKTLGGMTADQLADRLRQSHPACYRDAPMGAHSELFFLHPISALETLLASQQAHVDHSALASRLIGTYIQLLAQGTFAHVEHVMLHKPQEAMKAEWQSFAEASLAAGAYYSRPHAAFRDLAFVRDDGSAARMIGAAKALLDPKNIMNPKRFAIEEAKL